MRFLAIHAAEYNLDAFRVFAMGDSAGGHLAQMLLLTSAGDLPGDADLADASYQMQAGVSWYGPCDFEQVDLFNHDDRDDFRDRFAKRILGADPDPATKLQRYREVSPVHYLKSDSPPLLMIQGDQDTTIPLKHAQHMAKLAQTRQAPVETLLIKNAGHNWRKVGSDITPTRSEIIDSTVEFFLRHK